MEDAVDLGFGAGLVFVAVDGFTSGEIVAIVDEVDFEAEREVAGEIEHKEVDPASGVGHLVGLENALAWSRRCSAEFVPLVD